MTLSLDDYVRLAKAHDAALVYGVDLCAVLSQNGAANLTVCPECHIDDFMHVDACPVPIRIEHEMQEAEV